MTTSPLNLSSDILPEPVAILSSLWTLLGIKPRWLQEKKEIEDLVAHYCIHLFMKHWFQRNPQYSIHICKSAQDISQQWAAQNIKLNSLHFPLWHAGCCKLCAFKGYQNFTSFALSATAAIMAHNKGLELGADMVLLLVGGGVLTGIMW